MSRLTVEKPVSEMSMTELAHNCCFAKNGEAYYRDFKRVERLRDWIRKLEMKMGVTEEARLPKDDTAIDEELFDNLQYPITDIAGNTAFIYRLMWAMADLREVLKVYEDIGIPEELRALKEKSEPMKICYYEDEDTYACSRCGLKLNMSEMDKDYNYCPDCGCLFEGIERR